MTAVRTIFACKDDRSYAADLCLHGLLIGLWIYIIADGKVF